MPLAGALVDRSGRKKPLLGGCAYAGAAATTGMFFLGGERYLLGGALLIIANVSFVVAMMLYNSFLPQIAAPDERDAVSSRGWAFGYAAGALVLVADLALFGAHDSFGVTEGTAVRICLATAGLWWGIFTVIPLRRLRDRYVAGGLPSAPTAIPVGAASQRGRSRQQLRETLRDTAPPSPHSVLPPGLPRLQRRGADGDHPGVGVRLRGARAWTRRR